MSATLRSFAGAPDAPQHLGEFSLGLADLALAPLSPETPGRNFLLLFPLPGPDVLARSLGREFRFAADTITWLRLAAPLHLRSVAARPANTLAWRFTAAALPADLSEMVLSLPPGGEPLVGPRPLFPAEAALVLGLRSCPVAPALRGFWASAKLLEIVTHLLPEPAAAIRARAPASPVPDAPAPLPAPVRAALAFMEARLAEPIGLGDLAAAAGQSPAHFSRVFTQALGRGPTAHLRRLRMEHAGRLLAAGRANVTEAALAAGYQSLGQFSRVFAEHHGRPPSAFLPRNNG